MKKLLLILLLLHLQNKRGEAQSQELQQLILDVEKLMQFKQILNDLKKSYQILSGGYTTIKNLSQGNFSLHEAFLNGLLEVSPAVKKYRRVPEIIQYQLQIMKEYKTAFRKFKQDPLFQTAELDYIGKVNKNLVDESLKNLEALLNVLTANRLRMSDDERLKAIDGIYEDMQNKFLFLRHFNNQATLLAIQRAKENNDIKTLRLLFEAKK